MEKNKKKIICFVILSRANYSSIKSVMLEVKKSKHLEFKLIVGASALIDKYGSVSDFIEREGFKIDYKINNLIEDNKTTGMVKTTGMGMVEVATIFEKINPNIVFTVGDRYETISTAIAAAYMNITVAHTMGGEVSGTIDESIRHAVTKLSHIHFVSNKDAFKRVVKLGEDKKKVFNVGCPRIDIVKKILKGKKYLEAIKNLNKEGVGAKIDPKDNFIILSYHPVTTELNQNEIYITKILKVLKDIQYKKIILWPNSDAGSEMISKVVRQFREKKLLENTRFIKNVSIETYVNLLNKCKCLVGNSSSAIREGAYIGVPSVNIGSRQKNRLRGKNIIDSGYEYKELMKKIMIQSSKKHFKSEKIYGDGNSGKKIIQIIKKLGKINPQKSITY
jgi:UDP-hydrolysing UDP-N-acetyl-D-glucosamine 2-epimerase